MRMYHIVNCGLPGSTLYFYIISLTAQLKEVIEKSAFRFSLQICLKHFTFYEKNEKDMIKKCVLLFTKYPLLLSDFN